MVVRYNGITIDRKKRTIKHRARFYQFDARRKAGFDLVFQSICYLILSGGASAEMVFWHVYGGDPDGGPDAGTKVILIGLSQWKHFVLDKLDLEWRAWKIAGVSFYEIVSKYQPTDVQRFSFTASKHRSGRPIRYKEASGISSRKEAR